LFEGYRLYAKIWKTSGLSFNYLFLMLISLSIAGIANFSDEKYDEMIFQ